jgi:hypothetical protein
MYFKPVAVDVSTTKYCPFVPALSWVNEPEPVPTRITPLAVKLAALIFPAGFACCA